MMHEETLDVLNYLFSKKDNVFDKVDFDILFLGSSIWNISDVLYNATISENSGYK